jgi:hypothetical protein
LFIRLTFPLARIVLPSSYLSAGVRSTGPQFKSPRCCDARDVFSLRYHHRQQRSPSSATISRFVVVLGEGNERQGQFRFISPFHLLVGCQCRFNTKSWSIFIRSYHYRRRDGSISFMSLLPPQYDNDEFNDDEENTSRKQQQLQQPQQQTQTMTTLRTRATTIAAEAPRQNSRHNDDDVASWS